jgi:hypothetical protein
MISTLAVRLARWYWSHIDANENADAPDWSLNCLASGGLTS